MLCAPREPPAGPRTSGALTFVSVPELPTTASRAPAPFKLICDAPPSAAGMSTSVLVTPAVGEPLTVSDPVNELLPARVHVALRLLDGASVTPPSPLMSPASV